MRTAKQNRFRCLLPPPVLSHDLPETAPQPQSWAPRTMPGARQEGFWSEAGGRRRNGRKADRGQLSGGLYRSALSGRPLRSLCPVAPVLHWGYMESCGVKKWSFWVCVTVGWFPSLGFSLFLLMFLSLSPSFFSFFQFLPFFSLYPHPQVSCSSPSVDDPFLMHSSPPAWWYPDPVHLFSRCSG